MKTTVFTTEFNFAKSINVSLIAAPDSHASLQGIQEFITPYLKQIQDETVIPDYLTLVSIQTIEHNDAGVHILTFTINEQAPNDYTLAYDEDDTAIETITDDFRLIFPYDSEACFGSAPQINDWGTTWTITIPFTC